MRPLASFWLLSAALAAALLAADGGAPPAPSSPPAEAKAAPEAGNAADSSSARRAAEEFSKRILALELADEQWEGLAGAAVEAISRILSESERPAFERALPDAAAGGRARLEAALRRIAARVDLTDVQSRHLKERLLSFCRGNLTEAQQAGIGALQPGKEIEQPKTVPYAGGAAPSGGGAAPAAGDGLAPLPDADAPSEPSGGGGAGKGKKAGGAKKKKKK